MNTRWKSSRTIAGTNKLMELPIYEAFEGKLNFLIQTNVDCRYRVLFSVWSQLVFKVPYPKGNLFNTYAIRPSACLDAVTEANIKRSQLKLSQIMCCLSVRTGFHRGEEERRRDEMCCKANRLFSPKRRGEV